MIAIGLVCIAVGALYLNSAAYHLWLADGPPVNDPDIHLHMFYKHIFISLLSFLVPIIMLLFYWRGKKKRLGG